MVDFEKKLANKREKKGGCPIEQTNDDASEQNFSHLRFLKN